MDYQYINDIITEAVNQVKREMRYLKSSYDKMCPLLDTIIVQDLSRKPEDLHQALRDGRTELWNTMFKEQYNDYKKFIRHIEKFYKIKNKELEMDQDRWLQCFKTHSYHLYEFNKKDD